jgi:hypothetical protein
MRQRGVEMGGGRVIRLSDCAADLKRFATSAFHLSVELPASIFPVNCPTEWSPCKRRSPEMERRSLAPFADAIAGFGRFMKFKRM